MVGNGGNGLLATCFKDCFRSQKKKNLPNVFFYYIQNVKHKLVAQFILKKWIINCFLIIVGSEISSLALHLVNLLRKDGFERRKH